MTLTELTLLKSVLSLSLMVDNQAKSENESTQMRALLTIQYMMSFLQVIKNLKDLGKDERPTYREQHR